MGDDGLAAVAVKGLRDCDRPWDFVVGHCGGGDAGETGPGGVGAGFGRALGGAGQG